MGRSPLREMLSDSPGGIPVGPSSSSPVFPFAEKPCISFAERAVKLLTNREFLLHRETTGSSGEPCANSQKKEVGFEFKLCIFRGAWVTSPC
jgi:hypothetical protein